MGRGSDASDPQALLVHNVESGLKDLSEASKDYVNAVRGVDVALERLAVALRQLTLGDLPPGLRERVDRFGKNVGAHHNTSATPAARNSNSNGNGNGNGGAGEVYALASYMDDFSKQVANTMADLKALTKNARKKQEERDHAVSKYNDTRIEAEKIATSDVKKNRNSAENPKYVKKVQKRDTLRAEAEKKTREFEAAYEALVTRRGEVMSRAMNAISTNAGRYWTGVAQAVRSGGA